VKVENVKDIVDDQHCAIDLEKPSTCNDVDFTTDRSGRYNKDITVHHHGNSNKPATCQKEFDDWSHHLKKTRSASMMDTIPCPRSDCDETFNTATTLDRHLRDDHDFKQKILSCHSCNFRSVNPRNTRQLNCNYDTTSDNMKLVHWPLMGMVLHLVHRGGAWVGPQPAQAPPR